MRRHHVAKRFGWEKIVESQGLTFHSRDAPYWNEEACYEFSAKEIDEIERAGNELHELCFEAADYIIKKDLFDKLNISKDAAALIKRSWYNDDWHVYGRFDFVYDEKSAPKMLEYNADTPESLLEASVIQWFWLKDKYPDASQFNSIHEKLIDRWKETNVRGTIHFAANEGIEEDVMTVEYLRDTAVQAGMKTKYINMEDIGLAGNEFVDLEDEKMTHLFKLYPWEWMMQEEFGKRIYDSGTTFIEPAWKMLWSNKAILPLLWEVAPNHPNLLYASTKPIVHSSYVKKPIFSRVGSNVEIVDGTNVIESSGGDYGQEGYIYQEYAKLPDFEGNHPVLGVWMIGDECSGMGIRESRGLITQDQSRFVPHYFN